MCSKKKAQSLEENAYRYKINTEIDGGKTIRFFVASAIAIHIYILYIFYLYHDFISVTCPMCRGPIFQEKEPPSSSTAFQWIRSLLSFGALSVSLLTWIFETFSRLTRSSPILIVKSLIHSDRRFNYLSESQNP